MQPARTQQHPPHLTAARHPRFAPIVLPQSSQPRAHTVSHTTAAYVHACCRLPPGAFATGCGGVTGAQFCSLSSLIILHTPLSLLVLSLCPPPLVPTLPSCRAPHTPHAPGANFYAARVAIKRRAHSMAAHSGMGGGAAGGASRAPSRSTVRANQVKPRDSERPRRAVRPLFPPSSSPHAAGHRQAAGNGARRA